MVVESSAVLYASLRTALLLSPTELLTYVRMCTDLIKKKYRFHSRNYIEKRVEDECSQYMWNLLCLDDLFQHLIEIYDN